MLASMRRVVGPVVMVLACGPGPADESAGSTSAFTSSTAGEEASAPTTAITTGGETFVSCDIVLRGDVDDTASVQAALDGASDGATICFEGVFALGPIHVADRSGLTLIDAYASARSMDLPRPRAILDFKAAAAQMAWDGVVDLAKDNGGGQLDLCIRANGDADFVDFDALGLGAGKSFDLAPHDCAHPPLPPVEAP